uniref:Putative YopX protein n=1 Tax=viral metagenome TaxID=1070528 RepID=A0A6M3J271_9ZZZZ
MRELKFRQRIKGTRGRPDYWKFWGYLTDGYFELSMSSVEWDDRLSYQFTGLHDCEGTEIYEGDKCDANHPDGLFEGYIIYDDEQACFMLRTEICADIYLYEFDEIKIIGNIYEHRT